MTKQRDMLIGQLAKLAGVRPDSVRFYERSGLLPKPRRTASSYRIYDEAALNRLRFIKRAQAVGFSLDEIGRILKLREQGNPPCASVIAIAEATLSETEEKLRELRAFAMRLKGHLSRWRSATCGGKRMAAEFCGLIEAATQSARQGMGNRSSTKTIRPGLTNRNTTMITHRKFLAGATAAAGGDEGGKK